MTISSAVAGASKSVRAATLEKTLAEWTGRDMAALNAIAFKVGALARFGLVDETHAEKRLEANAAARDYFKTFGENETKVSLTRRFFEGRTCPVAKRQTPANDNSLITATPYEWRETSTIPVRSFVYGQHLIRGYVTVDVAPGGVGKSTQIIADALAMTTGRMLLGIEPADKLRCWLWNGEDPRDEIERRIAAACAFHKISEADIGGRLYVDSGRDKEIVVVTEDRNRIVYAVPVVEAVKATIRANNIDVFIVDPFVTTHGVPENDNTKIAAVAKQWAQIADDTKCAVQIVHHVRKGDGREITVEDMRGAGALANAARFVRLLNPMTTEEESSAGLKRGDRFRYFKVTNGKSNLTPRSEHSDWRQIVSQPMGNGTPLGQPQDRVGVVTRWQWPSAASLVEGLPDGALDAIKARLRGGDHREHELASNWAGLVVADVLKIELVDKGAKKQVKRMLQAWTDAGHLRVESKRDAVKRETKKFVVPVDKPAPQSD